MITENLSTLKIHKLTQAQYDRELVAGNIDPFALYLTPDSSQNFIAGENIIITETENGVIISAIGGITSDATIDGGSW